MSSRHYPAIEDVFIQVGDDGQYPNASLFNAALGFGLQGRQVTGLTVRELEERTPRVEDLVFGGVEMVRPYLEKLGCAPPTFDYPEPLRPFLDRDFEITTLAEVRRRYNEPGKMIFIKPVEHKEFTGHTVSQFRDLIQTVSVSADTEIYMVEAVDFISEWRFYIEEQKVVGVGHYHGDPTKFPDRHVLQKAVDAWEGAPSAYGLDFGVCGDGATRLVEVNDMICLGSYGLKPMLYSHLIERRWEELVGSGAT